MLFQSRSDDVQYVKYIGHIQRDVLIVLKPEISFNKHLTI